MLILEALDKDTYQTQKLITSILIYLNILQITRFMAIYLCPKLEMVKSELHRPNTTQYRKYLFSSNN